MSETVADNKSPTGFAEEPRISIAIPIHNEAASIPELLQRLDHVLTALPGGPHEIVIVDDGSTDSSVAVLKQLAAINHHVVIVELTRNFGHQIAVTAALDHVNGDVAIVMDGDLQDNPEEIPRFLEQYHRGYDVVYARRIKRKENLILRLSYYLAYRIISLLSNTRIPLDAGDFSLLSRRAVDAIRALPEKHRYVRGLRAWVGYRQIGVDVERAPRGGGASKYSAVKLVRLAIDGVVSFSIVPLRTSILLGVVGIVASCGYALYAVVIKLASARSPQGFTALIVIVVFLAALQLLILGVLGEYVGRIYEESKQRPAYLINRITKVS